MKKIRKWEKRISELEEYIITMTVVDGYYEVERANKEIAKLKGYISTHMRYNSV